jgi:hypothetical protein
MIDETHSLVDLTERYPSPSTQMTTGSPPLIHHGLCFGEMVVCIKAVREAIAIAKQRGDTAATAHLRAHLKEYEAEKKARDSHRAARDVVSRQRNGRTTPPVPILP